MSLMKKPTGDRVATKPSELTVDQQDPVGRRESSMNQHQDYVDQPVK